eukprot:TRINITY_DN453_c0_g1_i7.p1 TRINITY_DN453_c0_g1~~TRINITY_DN453_c0_g1_i7.p1  ORF type:complete len:104 (-),score=4.19 TRINITY_DN453_c0_g1_i7:186-497(-)
MAQSSNLCGTLPCHGNNQMHLLIVESISSPLLLLVSPAFINLKKITKIKKIYPMIDQRSDKPFPESPYPFIKLVGLIKIYKMIRFDGLVGYNMQGKSFSLLNY